MLDFSKPKRRPGRGGAAVDRQCSAESVPDCSGGDPACQFLDAMRAAGIGTPRELIGDGRIHRFEGVGDKRGSRNAWYLLHLDGGRPAGTFGSWRLGIRETWCSGGDGRTLTKAERDRLGAAIAIAKADAEAGRHATHQAAAEYARVLWADLPPADPAHPYLVSKAVRPHGLRQLYELLTVPLATLDGELWSFQEIGPEGSKKFLKGGRVTGLVSPIGDLESPGRLLICEGFSTGATLHEETGWPVLAAMNAVNLRPVAVAARERWPGADIVICADNDRFTRLPDGRANPGVTFAREAAAASGSRLAIPNFPEGCAGTDFNDLARAMAGRATP